MLEQISWKEFVIAIGGATIAYYGILAVAGKLRIGRRPSVTDSTIYTNNKFSTPADTPVQESQPRDAPQQAQSLDSDTDADSEFALLEQLADELQVIVTQFGTNPGSKEELIELLAKEIFRYPMLNKPAFRRAIGNLIIKTASEECSLVITEDDVDQCWPLQSYVDKQ